jgi:hypothetical protein
MAWVQPGVAVVAHRLHGARSTEERGREDDVSGSDVGPEGLREGPEVNHALAIAGVGERSSSLVTADVGVLHFSRYFDYGSPQIISLHNDSPHWAG